MKTQNIIITTILLALVCFALCQQVQSATDTPDPGGSLPVSNTADGQNALRSLTTGIHNTAIGFDSLLSNTAANFNTGVGSVTLLLSTGPENTAVGAGALFSNTSGADNTADGVFALFSNTEGHDNTAIGDFALFTNTIGANNTAVGRVALYDNTSGDNNTALGSFAGHDLTTGDNNIDIGFNVVGVAAESNTIRIGNTDITDTFIRGISGATVASGDAVLVASNGHLGTLTSSKRFKQDIRSMDKASEALFSLKPVTFRYKKEIDPAGTPQFGLVAEDVEQVNPDLVTRDENGRVNSVRYDKVNAMLLNEFLKEHKRVEEEQATIAELKSTIAQQHRGFEATAAKQQKEVELLTAQLKEQAAQIEKVSAELKLNKPAPRMVLTNR